jgi:hypothetical protein
MLDSRMCAVRIPVYAACPATGERQLKLRHSRPFDNSPGISSLAKKLLSYVRGTCISRPVPELLIARCDAVYNCAGRVTDAGIAGTAEFEVQRNDGNLAI